MQLPCRALFIMNDFKCDLQRQLCHLAMCWRCRYTKVLFQTLFNDLKTWALNRFFVATKMNTKMENETSGTNEKKKKIMKNRCWWKGCQRYREREKEKKPRSSGLHSLWKLMASKWNEMEMLFAHTLHDTMPNWDTFMHTKSAHKQLFIHYATSNRRTIASNENRNESMN